MPPNPPGCSFFFFLFFFLFMRLRKLYYELCESTIISIFFKLLKDSNGVSEWL